MAENQKKNLGEILWDIADNLRESMNAGELRDCMLSLLLLRYLSDNYEESAKKELGKDYPAAKGHATSLQRWYEENPDDVEAFEQTMRHQMHYVIHPDYLWSNIASMASRQDDDVLKTLQKGFKYIEKKSSDNAFQGLFSEINLDSRKLGNRDTDKNNRLCAIITKITEGLSRFSTDHDTLGDAYEYLIGQFVAESGMGAGEFYTPQQISTILSKIVTLDSQDPSLGKKKRLDSVLDFACGSGSLLLNVRNQMGDQGIGKIYGQEINITTYNLARMNMLLHGLKDSEFEIWHGDTLKNDWDMLCQANPAKKPDFDAVVAHPPFVLRRDLGDTYGNDMRFKNYGIAPKSIADFAFLLHGLHYLKDDGTMAIIMHYGALFRGGVEGRIRKKLLDDGNIDTVIGLPSNLFYCTGIPACILVLKKRKKTDDLLFINAIEHFEKGKRKNHLREEDVEKIVSTYQGRKEEERYSRRVSMEEIAKKHNYDLNVFDYVSTAEPEKEVDLRFVNKHLNGLKNEIVTSSNKHNESLRELELFELPKENIR